MTSLNRAVFSLLSVLQAKAAAMKMKFMAVNARDGENVEEAVLSLVTDTVAYQIAHRNDEPGDPWATPTVENQEEVCNVTCKKGCKF